MSGNTLKGQYQFRSILVYNVERIVAGHKKKPQNCENSLLSSSCLLVRVCVCVSGAPAGEVYEELDMGTSACQRSSRWNSVELREAPNLVKIGQKC